MVVKLLRVVSTCRDDGDVLLVTCCDSTWFLLCVVLGDRVELSSSVGTPSNL